MKGTRIHLPAKTWPIDFTVVGDTAYMLAFSYVSDTQMVRHGVWKSTDGVSFTEILTVDYPQVMQAFDYQYLVVNGFYGSANKTVTDYKKALNSHVSSLKTPYPAATVIWYGEYSQITKNRNSDYSNNYGSSYENVLNAFLGEMEGFSAIRAGDDFQWTLADIVPTAVAVSSVVDTDVSTSYTGYISSLTFGAPSTAKGLMLLFR